MSPFGLVITLSVAGAAVFWGSGLFFGRTGRRKAQLEAEALSAKLEQHRAELARAQGERQRLAQLAQASRDRESALKVELGRWAEQASKREAALARELEEARRRALPPPGGGAKSAELAAAQSEARAAWQEAAALGEREKSLASALARSQGDLARLDGENRRLEERLQEASAALGARALRIQELEQAAGDLKAELAHRAEVAGAAHRRELALAEERIAAARAEVAAAKEETARLKLVAGDVGRLSAELAAALDENRRLSALQFASQSPAAGSLQVRLREGKPERQALLAAVEEAVQAGSTSAVVSDGIGLPVAGAGEHAESLAGLAALFFDLAARASRFLPMRDLARASLEDVNGVAVSALALGSADPLLLVTLGVSRKGPGGSAGPARE